MDLDVPEEKIPKRASTEMLEAERLEDLETCMVGLGGTVCFNQSLIYFMNCYVGPSYFHAT